MPDFKPMLAAKANLDKLTYPVCVQPKLDGIRCTIVNGRPLTRTLKDVPNRAIRAALSNPGLNGLDGELIVGDPTAPDCYRQTASGVMREDGEPNWKFYVFDSYLAEGGFQTRWRAAGAAVAGPARQHARIQLVSWVKVGTPEALEKHEAELLEAGHEGAILRDPHGPYKFGRASVTKGELLKLKRFTDFEAEVIGVYEEQHNANEAKTNALGRTERSTAQAGKTGKDRLGGLILRRLKDGVEFRCGTGFDAHDRQRLWLGDEDRTAASLAGKTAKVKCFELGAKDKPRFPVFLGWRDMEHDGPR